MAEVQSHFWLSDMLSDHHRALPASDTVVSCKVGAGCPPLENGARILSQ